MIDTEEIETYRELADAVDENGGVATVKMRLLAHIHDVGRLGKHVRQRISTKLQGEGLGHYPEPNLPSSQGDRVRIYDVASPAGRLINAVTSPGKENDKKILQRINNDSEETVERIKELVCD